MTERIAHMDEQQTDTRGALEVVPKTWEGAFGAYKYSRAVILLNWKPYLLVVLATMVVSAIQEKSMNYDSEGIIQPTGLGVVVGLLSLVALIVLSISFIRIVLDGIDGKKAALVDVLKRSLPHTLSYLLMGVVAGLLLTVSFLLLIVPFFFVLPRLMLAEYFLIDKKMGPIESIKASWTATKGQAMKVWGVVGALIAMALLAFTIIGIPFAIYFLFMYSAAFGVLYAYLVRREVDTAARTA